MADIDLIQPLFVLSRCRGFRAFILGAKLDVLDLARNDPRLRLFFETVSGVVSPGRWLRPASVSRDDRRTLDGAQVLDDKG